MLSLTVTLLPVFQPFSLSILAQDYLYSLFSWIPETAQLASWEQAVLAETVDEEKCTSLALKELMFTLNSDVVVPNEDWETSHPEVRSKQDQSFSVSVSVTITEAWLIMSSNLRGEAP